MTVYSLDTRRKTSTTHCTWLVTEVVQHMLMGGIKLIVTVLDCCKAFDLCKFSLILKRLLDKGLPPIVVRVLAFIYMEQYGWVKWGRCKSSLRTISNGTRQGAILSPIFWAVYADPMLQRLHCSSEKSKTCLKFLISSFLVSKLLSLS